MGCFKEGIQKPPEEEDHEEVCFRIQEDCNFQRSD